MIDILIPFPGLNAEQAEPIRSAVLHVGLIPGRPIDQRNRPITGNHLYLLSGKALPPPETGESDDRLTLPHPLVVGIDGFPADLVLRISPIQIGPEIETAFRSFQFLDWFCPFDPYGQQHQPPP